MICLKRLWLVLLLGLLFSLSPIMGSEFLSQEEKKALPDLSKDELIKIILILDDQMQNYTDSLSENESSLNQREESLNEKEILLNQKEQSLNKRESLYNLQSQLFQQSLNLAEERAKQSFWNGFGIGALTGAGVGVILRLDL